MRLAFLCLLASAVVCRAQTAPAPDVDRRTRFFLVETIAKLDLEQVSLQEGLNVVRREWEGRHPDETFPVGLSEATEADGKVPKALITLKMQNLPFVEAVRYVGALGRKTLVEQHGLYILRNHRPEDVDWNTREYFLRSEALSALLDKQSTDKGAVCRAITELLGTENGATADGPEHIKMAWLPVENRLVVQAYPGQHDQIKGIVAVLNRGYKLVKPSPQTSGE